MARAVEFLRRHQVALMRIGGILMVLVGVLLVTGSGTTMTGRPAADLRHLHPTDLSRLP